MSVSLVVDGSPAGCRNAATGLRTLREEVDAASTVLARSMTAAAGAWSGSSSDAFTDFIKERIHRADDFSDQLLLIATGLESLGLGLADVKSELRRARAIAVRADIPVGSHLPEPGEIVIEPGQEGPLDHAVGVATRAREHETRLQTTWQELIGRAMEMTWDPAEVNPLVASVDKSLDSNSPSLGDLVPDLPDVDLDDLGSLPLPVGPLSKPVRGMMQGAIESGRKTISSTIKAGNEELERRYADGSLERDIRKIMYYNGVVVVTGAGALLCMRSSKGVALPRCIKGAHDAGKTFGKAQGDAYFGLINLAAR